MVAAVDRLLLDKIGTTTAINAVAEADQARDDPRNFVKADASFVTRKATSSAIAHKIAAMTVVADTVDAQ